MKKSLALLIAAVMMLSSFCFLSVNAEPSAPEEGYYITVTTQLGLTFTDTAKDKDCLVLDGASVSADAAYPYTAFFNGSFCANNRVASYKLIVDGTEKKDGVACTFNKGAVGTCPEGDKYMSEDSYATLTYNINISLNEGHYNEVILKAVDTAGKEYNAMKFTNLTVTKAEKVIDDSGVPVEYTPCYTLTPMDLLNGAGANKVSMQDNEFYTTFACEEGGDPYATYVSGMTKIGRFLLIKYRNNTKVYRGQIYMAQASITDDSNMIEYNLSIDGTWTYVVIDTSKNAYYDKDTMSVNALRYDPIEARNVDGGTYVFDGTETFDVAYIMGFTTEAGLKGYLEANELHDVTRNVDAKDVNVDGGKATYTNARGETYDAKDNGDGTYSYTSRDVRIPCASVPTLVLDGSHLVGSEPHNVAIDYDKTTGIATQTVNAESDATGDPNYRLISKPTKLNRYMMMVYKTSVTDQCEFFLSSTDEGPAAGQSFKANLIGDNTWHKLCVDLSAQGISTLDTETYEVKFIRMDIFDTKFEGSMDIEYIAFFDSEDGAFQYLHSYKTYTATFKAAGKTVEKVVFEHGATSIQAPEVPAVEGYTGVWADYTLADKNITIQAVYTLIDNPDTTAPDGDTTKADDDTTKADDVTTKADDETTKADDATTKGDDTTKGDVTTKGDDTTKGDVTTKGDETTKADDVTTKDDGKESGCGSIIGIGSVSAFIAVSALVVVARKKKED